jgi:tripartite-type tricarboxylate transporter receptor subunit TctC
MLKQRCPRGRTTRLVKAARLADDTGRSAFSEDVLTSATSARRLIIAAAMLCSNANGVIGDEMGVKAAPDGYTLLANSLAIAIDPGLYKLDYDITRDLAPVTQLASVDLLLGVHPQLPVKSVAELIALAKAQPGKLNYASFCIGSTAHLAAEMFKQASNTQIVHVGRLLGHARGRAGHDRRTNAVHVRRHPLYMLPHARAGRLNGIAVSSMHRSPLAPEIPTLNELGLAGFDVTAWFGMFVRCRLRNPSSCGLTA